MVNGVDRSFRALGNPSRRAIVERLARGTCRVGEATAGLELQRRPLGEATEWMRALWESKFDELERLLAEEDGP